MATFEKVKELPPTQEAFQRLSELWRSFDSVPEAPSDLAPELVMAARRKNLADGTRICIDRYWRSESLQEAIAGKKQETFTVTVFERGIRFTLTEEGLVELGISSLGMNIGDNSLNIPTGLYLGLSDSRLTPPSSRDNFQSASLNLVAWLETIIQQEEYIAPPISIAPSVTPN